MKFKSQVFTQVSGSIGGQTFAHNQGGLYTRARSIPTNPNSPAQQARRSALRTAVQRWTTVLTSAQRDGWTNYAQNTPVLNVFGDPINLSGQQMYVRSVVVQDMIGFALATDAPTINNLAAFTPVSIAITAAPTSDISVSFDDTDQWANEVGGALIINAGRGQNESINFFKGPFRFSDSIDGDAVAPSSPAVVVSAFSYAVGQKVFARVSAIFADGRLSTASIVDTIVA